LITWLSLEVVAVVLVILLTLLGAVAVVLVVIERQVRKQLMLVRF
jgi:hypothetical protein